LVFGYVSLVVLREEGLPVMPIKTPDWVKSAVFYQIFPDRFCPGATDHHPRGVTLKPWGTPAVEQGYQGGDLYGVIEKLEYLQSLGITALYLNPIFSSASNHRYHTFDYFQVDPLLGGNDALMLLIKEAHSRNMKVVLDGVFNHASRGFWAFHHILENGSDSPYLDWFHIEDFPLNPYPKGESETLNYQAWWDLPALPKFNTDNTGVRDYLFSVAEYWISLGIDGWRLDVPGDIDDDSFWQEFRRRVKALNPEAYICGEIWTKADRWLQGDQFDAVMNYPMGTSALSFFGAKTMKTDYKQNHLDLTPSDATVFCERVNEVFQWYDAEINLAQLNLLDSHDMPRAKWLVNENTMAVKQSLAFLLMSVGAPCIYYGTEIGMTGGNDPHCREAFPWSKPDTWDLSITEVIQRFTTIRKNYPVFTHGSMTIDALNKDVALVKRALKDSVAYVLFNRSSEPQSIKLTTLPCDLFLLDKSGQKTESLLNTDVVIDAQKIDVFVS
jgi:neopullulanase